MTGRREVEIEETWSEEDKQFVKQYNWFIYNYDDLIFEALEDNGINLVIRAELRPHLSREFLLRVICEDNSIGATMRKVPLDLKDHTGFGYVVEATVMPVASEKLEALGGTPINWKKHKPHIYFPDLWTTRVLVDILHKEGKIKDDFEVELLEMVKAKEASINLAEPDYNQMLAPITYLSSILRDYDLVNIPSEKTTRVFAPMVYSGEKLERFLKLAEIQEEAERKWEENLEKPGFIESLKASRKERKKQKKG